MAEPLITSTELQNRVTPGTWQAVFNDFNTGEDNEEADLQIRQDASSKVRATLGPSFPLQELISTNEVFASELRRLTLDVAHAMCAQRRPRLFPELDAFELMKQAERQLEQVRSGYATLASDPDQPTPGAGGSGSGSGGAIRVVTTGRTDANGRPLRFQDDWGDYG